MGEAYEYAVLVQERIVRNRIYQQFARVRYENRVNLISVLIGYIVIPALAVALTIYG